MSREEQLRQEIATNEIISWETWQEWNQLFIERIYPPFSKVVKSYDNMYIEQTKLKISSERRSRGISFDATFTYGESSWDVFLRAIEACEITESDRFVDLGCGKGQLCLFMKMKYGIPTYGVEQTPLFVKSAQMIAREQDLDINFVADNLINFNVKLATVFYITCTCFDEAFMERLTKKLLRAPKGSRIIIITQELDHDAFELISEGEGWFNWGKDTCKVYRRV